MGENFLSNTSELFFLLIRNFDQYFIYERLHLYFSVVQSCLSTCPCQWSYNIEARTFWNAMF